MERMTASNAHYTAEHCRYQAEKTRLQLKGMHDIDTKVTMHLVAEMYDHMAQRADERNICNSGGADNVVDNVV